MRLFCLFLPFLFHLTSQTKRKNLDTLDAQEENTTSTSNQTQSTGIAPCTQLGIFFLYSNASSENPQTSSANGNYTKKSRSKIETKNSVICFQYDEMEKKGKIIHQNINVGININRNFFKCPIHFYSDTLVEILDFPYLARIFSLGCSYPPCWNITDESFSFFHFFFQIIENNQKRHYLNYFSLSRRRNMNNLNYKFNVSVFSLLSIFCYSFGGFEKDLQHLKIFIEKIFYSIRRDTLLSDTIWEMFFEFCARANLDLKIKTPSYNIIKDHTISLPLISLIYNEKKNHSNEIIREYLDKLWDGVTKKQNDLSRINLSKFYQLEFMERICEITDKIETLDCKSLKSDPETEIVKLITSLRKLIEDFKFIGYKFPYRILRKGNLELFQGFLQAITKIECLYADLKQPLFECVCEFEVFFRLQCALYLQDIDMELKSKISNTERQEILQESMEVFSKFLLIYSISDVKKKIKNTNQGFLVTSRFDIVSDNSTSKNITDCILSDFQLEKMARELMFGTSEISTEKDNKDFPSFTTHVGDSEFEKFLERVDDAIQINASSNDRKLDITKISSNNSIFLSKPSNALNKAPIKQEEIRSNVKVPLTRNFEGLTIWENLPQVIESILNCNLLTDSFGNPLHTTSCKVEKFPASPYKRRYFLDEIDSLRKSSKVSRESFMLLLQQDSSICWKSSFHIKQDPHKVITSFEEKKEIDLMFSRYMEYFFAYYI